MPVYAYKATDAAMATLRGSVVAETPRQARQELRDRGLLVDEICISDQTPRQSWLPWRRYDARLVPLIRELATLLSAAIPLSEAINTVASQQRGAVGRSLAVLHERVSAGCGLADAMREQPAIYDELTVQMVEVGENAGNLDVVLDQLADFRERYVQFKDRVVTALFYPLVVLAMGVGVSIFLMTFVVPMLLNNLLEAGQEIPWPTRVLRYFSQVLVERGWLLVLGGACLLGGGLWLIQTETGKRWWHRLLLYLPVFGSLARKQEVARVALIISTLMESGLVFLQALEIATRAVKNVVLRRQLIELHDGVLAGRDIGEAMQGATDFPPLVVQIFTVGQQTGKLESMLARLSADYERQVASLTMRLATILEPVMIVVLAMFVGFILFATMLPILEAGNVL